MKICNICNQKLEKIFTKKILKKYDVNYFHCKNCHLIQTEKPYWLEESYKDTITDTDTGYVGRNILMSRVSLIIIYFLFKKSSNFLDYAGGYGLFTRLMNDYGIKFFWTDKYTKNIFAKGLEYNDEKIELSTCFECFEHFYDVVGECKKILEISDTIIFSTKLISKTSIPDPDTWGYYGFDHGQHITLYSERSLRNLASTLKLNFYTDEKNIHMITNKTINSNLFKILAFLPKLQIDLILKKLI